MTPTQLIKSIADDTRLKTVLLIMDQMELCVCELVAALSESQPKISRHLARLRTDGVLIDRKSAQWVYYQLNPALPDWFKESLHLAYEANLPFIEQQLNALAQMGDRPERQQVCCS
jgi:ArsR family transcriptional regulator